MNILQQLRIQQYTYQIEDCNNHMNNQKINKIKHNRQLPVGGVFWQYPQQFNYSNHNGKVLINNQIQYHQVLQQTSEKLTNNLQPTLPLPVKIVPGHSNPVRYKLQSSLLRVNQPRPNSQDNKHDYNKSLDNQKQKKQRRAESLRKVHHLDQQNTTIRQNSERNNAQNHEFIQKSSNKTMNFNQYQSPISNSLSTSRSSRKQNVHSSQIQSTILATSSNCNTNRSRQQAFLSQCLNHVTIQNSCLTKQMVLKQLQLSKLRMQLQKLRKKHQNFKNSKIQIQKYGNMDTILSASQEDSQNASQCNQKKNIKQNKTINQIKTHIKSQGMNQKSIFNMSQKIIQSQSINSGQLRNLQNQDQNQQANSETSLKQIHQIITQIKKQQKKLQQIFNASMNSSQKKAENNLIDMKAQKQKQLNQGVTQPSQKQKYKNKDNGYRIQGVQCTRLDRFRMRKGIVTKRFFVQDNNKS